MSPDASPPGTAVHRTEWLGSARRIVVKIGSAIIARHARLRPKVIADLAYEIAVLRHQGFEVVMVVSGAVAGGYPALGIDQPPTAVVARQAAACIGQNKLMTQFAKAFKPQRMEVAQLLIMAEDIEHRRRFLSARHALQTLVDHNVIPIINENDPLADDEFKIGDNDHLAAMVANLVSADLLVILSTVDGLRRDGGKGALIETCQVDDDCSAHVADDRSATGVGGMAAKLSAAQLAAQWGVPTVIASGEQAGTLQRVAAGEPVGTFFVPTPNGLSPHRRWIAGHRQSRGTVQVDAATAVDIQQAEGSVLPAGVTRVDGIFPMGARVDIQDPAGAVIAVGLVSYAGHEIQRMIGRRASDYEQVLGYTYVPEIIDHADMVVLPGRTRPGQPDPVAADNRSNDPVAL